MSIYLILFILLVIVICTFGPFDRVPDQQSTSIASTKGFDVINETSNLTLIATSISGRFQSSFPPLVNIPAGGRDHFEVIREAFSRNSAFVSYNAVHADNRRVGTIDIEFVSYNLISGGIFATLIGPISYSKNFSGTAIYIANKDL
ncbi:hypothetical protein [Paenibacillus herberti]|uniref:Uncharacterized protein n=1 Tax=Paenibacillus herberti TaxID=1619309 RepID=A0A229NZR2_9BACL|nr:hypothetical protein [Paenibacillus herberti]OXM15347.1 hypothetical protein CGZ75_00955 [Paenibacillus herberti]